MSASLEDLLNAGPSAPKSAAPAAEVSQPEPPEPEVDNQPQEVAEPATGDEPQGSPAAPPAASIEEPLDKKISAFQRKAEDETRKRQDYERQLADAKKAIDERDTYIKQVREWQAQQQAAAAPEIDLLDPQQAQTFIANQLQPQLYETRVLLSQEIYRGSKPDYDEMETIFAEQCTNDPALRAALQNHPVPAKFAYEEGKRIKLMRELSDPEAYRAKMREEILAELKSQPAEAQPALPSMTPAAPVPQPPRSLASVPSAARNVNRQPWKGPTPLDQLLN